MLGFHYQRPVNDWPQAVALLPVGTWVKAIDNVQMLKEAKQVNPGIKTVLRHWYDPDQVFGGDLNANKARARTFLNTFVDGTFRAHAPFVDAIEDFNEYLANSQNPPEIQDRITWVKALSEVWTQEYRTQGELAHIRLVIANAAIGNDIPLEIARQVDIHDNILGYHAYWPVFENAITPPNEWPYYSGRWTVMDESYRANGVTVNWLFTECGAVGNRGGHLDPVGGWKSDYVHGGSVTNYKATIGYFLNQLAAWNAAHSNRAYGGVLFTSDGNPNGVWKDYDILQPAMGEIATFIRDHNPVPPPTPTPGDWQSQVWEESIRRQTIRLNPQAALQNHIFADGFTPIETEFWYTAPADGIQRACMGAENLAGARRVYYAVVPQWNDVRWFSQQGDSQGAWEFWPTPHKVITQAFGADPQYYGQFGLPGHEGLDIQAPHGAPIVAVWTGEVYEVVNHDDGHAYGVRVRIRSGKYHHIYAHLQSTLVTEGQHVTAGEVIGRADNTGNSRATHLHITIKHDEAYPGGSHYAGYPYNIIDPTPYALPLL